MLLVRRGEEVRALSAKCTHLGCTVSVSEDRGSLFCPCHGSEYDLDGGVLKGPAPRALVSLDVERLDDGSCRVIPI